MTLYTSMYTEICECVLLHEATSDRWCMLERVSWASLGGYEPLLRSQSLTKTPVTSSNTNSVLPSTTLSTEIPVLLSEKHNKHTSQIAFKY